MMLCSHLLFFFFLKFCARKTVWRISSSSNYLLNQVNLCEWRKMLTQVDTSRCMRRGVSSSEVSAAAKKAGSGGGYNNHSNNKSNSDGSSNGNTTRVGKRLPLEVPMPTEATKPAEE
jgi:hypothetical protein